MDISLPQAYESFLNELDKYSVEDMEELLAFAFWSGWKAAGGDVPEGNFWNFFVVSIECVGAANSRPYDKNYIFHRRASIPSSRRFSPSAA